MITGQQSQLTRTNNLMLITPIIPQTNIQTDSQIDSDTIYTFQQTETIDYHKKVHKYKYINNTKNACVCVGGGGSLCLPQRTKILPLGSNMLAREDKGWLKSHQIHSLVRGVETPPHNTDTLLLVLRWYCWWIVLLYGVSQGVGCQKDYTIQPSRILGDIYNHLGGYHSMPKHSTYLDKSSNEGIMRR